MTDAAVKATQRGERRGMNDDSSVLEAGAPDIGQPGCGDLIARLEAASEGSRGLDGLIALLLGWDFTGCGREHIEHWPDIAGRWHTPEQNTLPLRERLGATPYNPGLYTTSLDAALTLVPEGMSADVHVGPHHFYNQAVVWQPIKSIDDQGRRTTRFEPHTAGEPKDGKIVRNTPALALCIAALKARAAAPQPQRVSDRTTPNTDAAQAIPHPPQRGTPWLGPPRT